MSKQSLAHLSNPTVYLPFFHDTHVSFVIVVIVISKPKKSPPLTFISSRTVV